MDAIKKRLDYKAILTRFRRKLNSPLFVYKGVANDPVAQTNVSLFGDSGSKGWTARLRGPFPE